MKIGIHVVSVIFDPFKSKMKWNDGYSFSYSLLSFMKFRSAVP